MSTTVNVKRTPTLFKGKSSERVAQVYLRRCGYKIVKTNYAFRGGEVDIIARDGRVLSFVEVRSRSSVAFGHPLETVDHTKRRKIIRTALHYAARLKHEPIVRFDVLSVVMTASPQITLIKGAFDASGQAL